MDKALGNDSESPQFAYVPMPSMSAVRAAIRGCEGRHVQQVAYSSFMDTLTQVCFTCQIIRSTIGWSGNRSWNLETKQGGLNGRPGSLG